MQKQTLQCYCTCTNFLSFCKVLFTFCSHLWKPFLIHTLYLVHFIHQEEANERRVNVQRFSKFHSGRTYSGVLSYAIGGEAFVFYAIVANSRYLACIHN